MRDAQHTALAPYIRDLADRLLLRDWEIDLGRQMAGDGTWADIWIGNGENRARIRLQHPEFFGESLERQREYIVHELMHIPTGRLNMVMERINEMLPDDAMIAYAGKCFHDEHEIVTQWLARIIAPLMPLPPAVRDL